LQDAFLFRKAIAAQHQYLAWIDRQFVEASVVEEAAIFFGLSLFLNERRVKGPQQEPVRDSPQ
jgi:hypothetical protein